MSETWDWWADIDVLVAWLDTANGRSELQTCLQLLKLSEEVGEVAEAYIGVVGQNPRKGITHTRDDVATELCDVMVTAAIALTTITGNTMIARGFLASKMACLVKRAES